MWGNGWLVALMLAGASVEVSRATVGASGPAPPVPDSAAGTPAEPGLFSHTLPNGLLVLVRERPSTEVAAISVGIRGGSRDEEPETVGAAHFMEHMYFQGTPTRESSQEIDREITSRGGWLNAWTGWESINFQTLVPYGEFDRALAVISDLLVNSLFEESKIDKERRVVLEELNRRLNSPAGHAQDVFARTIFAGHPAENLPIGNRETLARSTRDVLVKFRDTYFVANNTVVAVVGNVQHEEVFAKVETAFAGMPSGPRPSFHPAPPPPADGRLVEGAASGRQARLAMGVPAPGSDNDDRYALDVLVAVFGDAGRRLHNEVVEQRGLASDIGVAFWELTDVGVWQIWAAATPENVQPVIDIVKDNVRVVRSTVLEEADLDEAKAYIRGTSRLGLESSISQAQRLADGVVLGRYESLDEYLGRVQAVSAEDVRTVARKYLDPDAMTVVVLKPEG
jgi:predicted Zn-dependent peptidase